MYKIAIDVDAFRTHVLNVLYSSFLELSKNEVLDYKGRRISHFTEKEVIRMAQSAIEGYLDFDENQIPSYISQFPTILHVKLTGSVRDGVFEGIKTAIFDEISSEIIDFTVGQYSDFSVPNISNAVSDGLCMYDRYLSEDPFATLRIKKDRLIETCDAVCTNFDMSAIRNLTIQLQNLASEFSTRPKDAQALARELVEIQQYLTFVIEGRLEILSHQSPERVAFAA